MYESPITILRGQIEQKLEDGVYEAVMKYGFDINKEELLKALKYDRDQYDAGYRDAKQYYEEQIKMLETLVFGIVRNSSVYPTGVALGKSQKEVTLKTFETIEEIKKIMDFDRMREFMALKEATDEENT